MELKIAMIIIVFSVSNVFSNTTYSQVTKVSLDMKNTSLEQVMDKIESQSEFYFIFNQKQIDVNRVVDIQVENKLITDILPELFNGTDVNYAVLDRKILLTTDPLEDTPTIVSITESQQNRITGTVTDRNGTPLPGANVIVTGATLGTITDSNGKFSIEAPPGSKSLTFSFIGMEPQEIAIGTSSQINVTMVDSEIGLDEVVVIGYGTQKRREVTGSIFKVDATKLTDIPTGQISQKIQGKVAGVQINETTGIPGRDIAIRIRGAASINAGNSPLYVVDGFPIEGGMSSINPNEIESISILKGSSASSMFGSRAANGVVLITTKRAAQGQNIVQFSAMYGVGQVPQKGRFELMNSKEFLQDRKSWWEDRIKYEGWTGGVPELYQNPDAWTGPDTDWYDVLLQPAVKSSYNLSFLSSKGKFSSATTVGYYKEDGAVINSGYQRYSLRSNNDYQVNDHVRVGFNLAPNYQRSKNVEGTDGYYSMLFSAIITPPIFSPNDKNPDGSPMVSFTGPGLFTFPNWKLTAEEQTNLSDQLRILSNAYVEVDFLKNFQFKSSLSVDLRNQQGRIFRPSTTGSIFSPPPQLATGQYASSGSRLWMFENTLNFTKTIATNHNINAIVGYSAQNYRLESGGYSGNQFPDDLVSYLNAAANITTWNNSPTEWALLSMYGRFNYNYKGRYLISASLRRDGSSRFGADQRWGSFPSISAGWIISDENFANQWDALSYLKLRSEYGVVGNFNIGDYTQYGNISTANYVFGNSLSAGRSQNTIGNQSLTWETTEGWDIGLDVAFFKDRIGITMDYYDKSNSDMLYQIDIPSGSGYTNIQDNIGEFHLWGYEFDLNTKNLVGDFKWYTNFNITFNRNKVIKLGTNNTPIGGIGEYSGSTNKTEVGHPIGMFWGYVSDGIYMTQEEFDTQPKHASSQVGTARFKNLNSDNVIDINDRQYIGNPNPKFIFGLSNTFSYKSFDLDILISGAYGGDKMRAILEWSETLEGIFNVEKYEKDRWRSPENPGAGMIGRTLSGTTAFARVAQSRYVEDASFLTIKNITLGYTLPKIKNVVSARVFTSIQQALVFTKYRGVNPEASLNGLNALSEGLDVSPYPVPRTFAFGVDFTF